jgi:hypothetical protein
MKNYYATMNYFETGLGQRIAIAIAGSPKRVTELLKETLHPYFHDLIENTKEGLPETEFLPPAVRMIAEKYPGVIEHTQQTYYNLS